MLIYITARSEPICNIGCTKRKTNKDSNIHEIGFGSTLLMVEDNCRLKRANKSIIVDDSIGLYQKAA